MKHLRKSNTSKCEKNTVISLLTAVFSLVFLISVIIGTTGAKYISEENAPFGEEKSVDFTVNSVFVVDTADELFAAINQGYTYVQLDKSIENPLIITQKAENLNSDLILDLNGIEIQRNGYEPILNINEGVRLTVVDSSDEQTGGLYNPVGSVFNINGGTLTVVTGFFESGPRYSEYYTYNSNVLNGSESSVTKRTLVENDAQNVTYYNAASKTTSTVKAPIIKSYPTKKGEITYTHGNLYFDEDIKRGDITINADTYCYYRTDESTSYDASSASMANWYYTYYVTADNYNYVGTTAKSSTDVKVTIYGYDNVVKQASEKTDMTDYYAAVQMSNGSLEIQNGSFYQYFGVDTTACVNAQGGTITVNQGTFSSRTPNATEYTKNAVYVKESDKKAFDTNYFDNFAWYNTAGLAKGGESYCILNGGSATVKIDNGTLCSSNNSIINMQGGELSISNGTLTKSLTNGLKSSVKTTNLSAVNMQSGMLSVTGSSFDITGDNTYAIYSTVVGDNNFNIKNTSFNVKGNQSTGIYSSNGTVHISASDSAYVSVDGSDGKGIFVENGGSVFSENYSYKLNGKRSYGIYSTSGGVTMSGGSIFLESDENCYGIYAASNDKISINVNNSVIAIGYSLDKNKFNSSTKTGTVEASVGVFLSSQNQNSVLNLTKTDIYSYELGIVSNGGAIHLYEKGNIVTNKASAIAIRNGSVSFDKNSDYTVTSQNTTTSGYTNSYTLTLPIRNGDTIENSEYVNTDGIYVNGGSLISMGKLNITHTGLRNKTLSSGYDYSSLVVTSYALRVYGGDVIIEKGTITATIGGGIYSGKSTSGEKGSVVLGSEGLKNDTLTSTSTRDDIVKVYTKGQLVGAMYDSIGSYVGDGWKSYQSITGGHTVELDGGNITIYNGIFEAQFGNGVFVNGTDDEAEENGKIDIYNGLFYGYMNAVNSYGTSIDMSGKSGPSAFYGLKVVGGSVVNIYDGSFDGGNGGAFVTGVTKINSKYIAKSKTAYVYIYKGSFGSNEGNLDAFNVYDDVKIVFGAYTKNDLDAMNLSATEVAAMINLNSTKTSIAANSITYNSSSIKSSEIYVYYGTYNGIMYLETSIIKTQYYNTYNCNLKYTICNTVLGDKNNTTAEWFKGSF